MALLPALGPAIQEEFGLSLVQVTAVFTAFAVGTVTTLLAWGVLADFLKNVAITTPPLVVTQTGFSALSRTTAMSMNHSGVMLSPAPRRLIINIVSSRRPGMARKRTEDGHLSGDRPLGPAPIHGR